MKISKLFHWLYCAVMFLPLFCLPVYALAVRSDNNYQPIEITTTVPVYYDSNEVQTSSDFVLGNVYRWTDNYVTNPNYTNVTILNIEPNDMIKSQFNVIDDTINNIALRLNASGYCNLMFYENATLKSYFTVANQIFDFVLVNYNNAEIDNFISHIEECNVKYVKEYNTNVLYNDTDFGSQTIYTLYKEVDDYFNYDNVLSIGELYDWCNLNLFNGNASLGFFIFFHLLEYWLLTSLLWLIFDILMYVPQLCHRWLDKASLE